MSIEESKDIGRMAIDELQSSLSVHEKKFKKSIYHPSRGKIAESVMSANRMFVLLGETSDKASDMASSIWSSQLQRSSHST